MSAQSSGAGLESDGVRAGRRADVESVLETVATLGQELASAGGPLLGEKPLSHSQRAALFRIAHSAAPVTPSLLARALDVTVGAVTQLIEGPVAHDLVVSPSQPWPHPRRSNAAPSTSSANPSRST